ncbi:transglycosylase SLT domain-containing protein [Derxia gummosa]|uniref:Transglycosylase SLT domain-containing protein n=1 Tax=Derxia gummosa DSM 723 TaxID=1121388 RepID=A0A9U5GGW4_9BURK|nr:transglycosylase SLT domain-containing protein [Derxia gummosa]
MSRQPLPAVRPLVLKLAGLFVGGCIVGAGASGVAHAETAMAAATGIDAVAAAQGADAHAARGEAGQGESWSLSAASAGTGFVAQPGGAAGAGMVLAPSSVGGAGGVLATSFDMAPPDLWERIRRGFSMPDLSSQLVEARERWYAERPQQVRQTAERASRYLFHIVDEIERRGMPTEIALLPFIESAFNPQALSPAAASGIWQFIPGTGKTFGLRQNLFRDDRRDVLESTRAALDYLGKLHDMFGDWHLALAAYNWGEGAVQRAIEKNQRRGLPTDYASLDMPAETRNYVPRLQAVKNIVANPGEFRIDLPRIDNERYFATVPATRDIDVNTAARLAGMTPEEFRALNPSFNRPVILAATGAQIVLPVDRVEGFQKALDAADGALANYTTTTVGRRERVETIASRYGMDPMALRALNNIPRGMLVRAGATLIVPRNGDSDANAAVPDAALRDTHVAFEPEIVPSRRVMLTARRGETVAEFARRSGVSVADVRQWNKLDANDKLSAGQRLAVYVEQAGREAVKVASTVASAGLATVTGKGAKTSKTVAVEKATVLHHDANHVRVVAPVPVRRR